MIPVPGRLQLDSLRFEKLLLITDIIKVLKCKFLDILSLKVVLLCYGNAARKQIHVQ